MASGRQPRSAPTPLVPRRSFLAGAAGLALTGWARQVPARLPDGLFALGVASGDPGPHSVVLWTRLAPDPLAGGGMPPEKVRVHWEVARDERFRRVVRAGTTVAVPGWAHSVHVTVPGLRPDAWYHYRFRVGDQVSAVGRTRTAPAAGRGGDLRFLFASCQNWKDGYWPAWAAAPGDDPDLVVHLGDYIYESGHGGDAAVRDHDGPEARTLDQYRNRYALYKGDPALQAAHAACPWVVTWDDHEVQNNYAGLRPQHPAEAAAFPARRAAAYQAWWEHQPVRLPPPSGPDLRIHRTVDWGRLARFHVLDTRQHRDDQPCPEGRLGGDIGADCGDRTAPGPTMLGDDQERWLGRSLQRSDATWDVLANQAVMTSMPLAGTVFNMDQWDGYPAARSRLFDQLRQAGTENPVVITGDIHAAGVADLVDEGPGARPIGTELVGPSISSTFDPGLADVAEQLIGALPHVRYANVRQRGYVRCDVTHDELVARFRFAESVATPDAPVATASTWTVTSGSPGAHEA